MPAILSSSENHHDSEILADGVRTDLPNSVSAPSTSNNYFKLFLALCAAHFLIWVIIPCLTQHNASLDLIEMLYWGREWQLGYHKHPPLPAWTSQTLSVMFGSVAWPSFVVSQICILACMWSVWTVTKPAFGQRAALLCALMLEGCYYYHYTTPEFNNNTLSRTFWALTIAFLYHAIIRRNHWFWALSGLTLALGLLSKYDCSVLAISMLLFSIVHPEGRKTWRTPGPYLAFCIAILIFTPHLYWLKANSFTTIEYVKNRAETDTTLASHFLSPMRFLFTQALAISPMLLITFPVMGRQWQKRIEFSKRESFSRDFILAFSLIPLLIVVGVGMLTGAQFQSMWGTALFTFTGPAVMSFFVVPRGFVKYKASWKVAFGITSVAAVALVFHDIALPNITRHGTRVNFPGRELGRHVDQVNETELKKPLRYVAGPRWVAGNAAFYSIDRPSVYPNLDSSASTWVNDALFAANGGLIVWQEADYQDQEISALRVRFPMMQLLPPVELDACDWDLIPPTKFFVAVVPAAPTVRKTSN